MTGFLCVPEMTQIDHWHDHDDFFHGTAVTDELLRVDKLQISPVQRVLSSRISVWISSSSTSTSLLFTKTRGPGERVGDLGVGSSSCVSKRGLQRLCVDERRRGNRPFSFPGTSLQLLVSLLSMTCVQRASTISNMSHLPSLESVLPTPLRSSTTEPTRRLYLCLPVHTLLQHTTPRHGVRTAKLRWRFRVPVVANSQLRHLDSKEPLSRFLVALMGC